MDLEITVFQNRKASKGQVVSLSWEALVDKLRNPVFTEETIDEYQSLTNEQRTEIKDVGGFVGGRMKNGVRRKNALENRTVLTIDADDADENSVPAFEILNDAVFCCHTTHTSTKQNPRLRWVFPLSRPVTAEEYSAIARVVANWVGAETIDETTDQPERLMFWPSVSFDADYGFWEGGAIVLDPDELLDIAEPIAEPKITENHVSDGALSVPEGNRNKTVFSFAATLRGSGLDYKGIRSMLSEYNDRYCDPPLPEEELDTICRSVCGRYAPGAAVASSLRDAWDDFNDLGEWKESAPRKIEQLEAESMCSLGSRHIDPPKFAIPGLIPYGITILASPPKFGKSWMCLDMAISVATGTEFMGIETRKDGVVYLALEDGDYRLQDRGRKVANGRELPENLYLVKQAPILADGLLQQISNLLDKIGEPIGMIIIDTLQKVRGVAGKTEGVYGYDYRELGLLHQFALDKNIAVVLVHHLNKGGDDSDFVSRLNGSTGVSGAADSIITLTRVSRGSDETKMSITGRDVQERVLIIQMDWSNFRWICLGNEKDVEKDRDLTEFKNDPLVKTILWRLADAEDMLLADEETEHHEAVWSCTSKELMDEVKRLYNETYDSSTAVGMKVKRLAGKLAEVEGITYDYRRVGANRSRTHVFTREIV